MRTEAFLLFCHRRAVRLPTRVRDRLGQCVQVACSIRKLRQEAHESGDQRVRLGQGRLWAFAHACICMHACACVQRDNVTAPCHMTRANPRPA